MEEGRDKNGRFAKGSKCHRPLMFKSPKEIEIKIEEYFKSCYEEKWFDEIDRDEQGNKLRSEDGKYIKKPVKKSVQIKPMTITGLASFLGTNRTTLIRYEEKEPFYNTIKRAKEFIESNYEERALMNDNNPTFSIFTMKNNFNWKDQSSVDVNQNINKIELEIIEPNDSKNTDN